MVDLVPGPPGVGEGAVLEVFNALGHARLMIDALVFPALRID